MPVTTTGSSGPLLRTPSLGSTTFTVHVPLPVLRPVNQLPFEKLVRQFVSCFIVSWASSTAVLALSWACRISVEAVTNRFSMRCPISAHIPNSAMIIALPRTAM